MLRGGIAIRVELQSSANLTRASIAAKRIGLLLPTLMLLVLAGCDKDSSANEAAIADLERRASSRAPISELAPFHLPEASPGPEEKIAFYIGLLERGDLPEVEWAGGQLAMAGEPAVPELARAIDRALPSNPGFAENVLSVFGDRLKPVGVLPTLARAATSPVGRIRAAVARALGNSGDPEAAAPLLDLAGDSVYQVADEAVRALATLGAMEGVRGLRGRFPDRLTEGVRVRAVGVIGRHTSRKDAIAFLLSVLGLADEDLVIAAADALLDLEDRSGLEPLVDLLDEGLEGQRHYAALSVLARAEDQRIVATLYGSLDSAQKSDVIAAIGLLGFFRNEKVRARLWELADDPDEDVRQEAMNSLVRSGDAKALPKVRRLLGSSRPADRTLAARLLGAARDPSTVGDLVKAADLEEVPKIRMQLVNGLALLGEEEGASAIVRSLLAEAHEDPSLAMLARTAKVALTRFSDLPEEALALLVQAAKSDSRAIRFHSAMPLARAGRAEREAAALARLLTDPALEVRRVAAPAWLAFRGATLEPARFAHSCESDLELAKALVRVAHQLAHRWTE